MQDERDIVGLRRRDAVTIARGRVRQADEARFVHLHCVVADFARGGGLAGFIGAVRRAEQNPGGGVVEIEAEFFLAVAGVERRGGAGDGSGEKRDDRGQAVRQHDGDPVSALDARGGEPIGHREHLLAQGAVGHADTGLRQNHRGVAVRSYFDEIEERGYVGH